jgi:hypothetical protein
MAQTGLCDVSLKVTTAFLAPGRIEVTHFDHAFFVAQKLVRLPESRRRGYFAAAVVCTVARFRSLVPFRQLTCGSIIETSTRSL